MELPQKSQNRPIWKSIKICCDIFLTANLSKQDFIPPKSMPYSIPSNFRTLIYAFNLQKSPLNLLWMKIFCHHFFYPFLVPLIRLCHINFQRYMQPLFFPKEENSNSLFIKLLNLIIMSKQPIGGHGGDTKFEIFIHLECTSLIPFPKIWTKKLTK